MTQARWQKGFGRGPIAQGELWVEVGPPRWLRARNVDTGKRLERAWRYMTNVVGPKGRRLAVLSAQIELVAEFADEVTLVGLDEYRASEHYRRHDQPSRMDA